MGTPACLHTAGVRSHGLHVKAWAGVGRRKASAGARAQRGARAGLQTCTRTPVRMACGCRTFMPCADTRQECTPAFRPTLRLCSPSCSECSSAWRCGWKGLGEVAPWSCSNAPAGCVPGEGVSCRGGGLCCKIRGGLIPLPRLLCRWERLRMCIMPLQCSCRCRCRCCCRCRMLCSSPLGQRSSERAYGPQTLHPHPCIPGPRASPGAHLRGLP